MLSPAERSKLETVLEAQLQQALKQGANPEQVEETRKMFNAVASGELTLQDVAGVSDEQVEAVFHQAVRSYESGMMAKALELLEQVLVCNPYHQGAWRATGAVYQELGKLDEALGAYEYALALDPDDVVSSIFKGEVLLQTENVEEALPLLKNAVERAAGQPELDHWRARAEIMLDAHMEPVP